MDFSILFTASGLFYVLVLSLFEIVLGIDNIIFISVVTDALPKENQRNARNIGLILALIIRLLLLSIVGWLMGMTDPIFEIWGWQATVQSIILLVGGLFLIYKSTVEMHKNVVGEEEHLGGKTKNKLSSVIFQIVMIDIVFSFDSIITAIGMTNGIAQETGETL